MQVTVAQAGRRRANQHLVALGLFYLHLFNRQGRFGGM
jgi:hypothetical protein